ncbi:MAG: FtsX-like permease family protein [Cytophagales bacterium]|nr:FtsX-like permease family protein [Cytophagales bacterium]
MNTPKWPLKWLSRVWVPELVEHMIGDLHEIYEDRLETRSVFMARLLFYRDCFQLLRPYLFKPFFQRSKTYIMINNHLKIGYRNLLKYRNYSLINLLGLSLGLAASIILYRVVDYENSFDSFHVKKDNLYFLAENTEAYGSYYQTRTPAAEKLKEDLPEVVRASRFFSPHRKWLTHEEKKLNYRFTYVDADLADMLTFQVLEGDLHEALKSKDHIVISMTVAQSFFGYEEAVGQVLTTADGENQYIVGAVVNDFPSNSSLEFEVLTSWEHHRPAWLDEAGDWHNTFMTAFVELREGVTPSMIQDKLNQVSVANFLPAGNPAVFYPVSFNDFYAEFAGQASVRTLLLIIALAISFIAFINFVNLSTAQSLNRVKEVAIRKVMGSRRKELIWQFTIESVMICCLAILVAFVFSYFSIPLVNQYFDLGISSSMTELLSLFPVLILLAIVLGMITALYPSAYLIGSQVSNALKGDSQRGSNKMLVQKVLIILQYVASIVLIAGTIVIWRQIAFMKSQNLNIQTDEIIVVSLDYSSFSSWEKGEQAIKRLQQEARNQSFIKQAAQMQMAPGSYNENYNSFQDVADANNEIHMRQAPTTAEAVEALGMEIVIGRNLNSEMASDSTSVLINESAYEVYGWSDLNNKRIKPSGDGETYQVVGVVKDYHYQGLVNEIEPIIHWNMGKEGTGWHLLVRYEPGQAEQTVDYLKEAWSNSGSFIALNYYFLDGAYDDLYREQEKIGSIATAFALIAIVLATLGLFALASYLIRRRRKEIGIRKVMGATIQQITMHLSKSFLLWVFIALVIAVPIINYSANQFLADFAFRTSPGIDIYLIAAMIAIFMAFVSVGIRSYSAASDDPVNSLRDE